MVYVRSHGDAIYWRDGSLIWANDGLTSPNQWLEEWTLVNNADNQPLMRQIDPVRDTWRVDIPGLPQGTYDVRVTDAGGTPRFEAIGLETRLFSRLGAAFVPSDQLIGNSATTNFALDGATGGYLSDGRVDPTAVIMYVSHDNMAIFANANLGINSAFRGGRPLIVRFSGTVGSFVNEGLTTLAARGAQVPPDVGNNGMMTFPGTAHQLTLEGVGPDATIFGWGMFTGGAVNVVFRNLHVDKYFQQGFRASGNSTNVWVHNSTFHYGQNRFLNNNEPTDRTMGQGAVDIEQNVRGYTIAYNHFNGGRGTHLIVGSVQNVNLDNNLHRHYGTLHHNIYQSAQERNPRTRHHNLHMFNNLFLELEGFPLHATFFDRYTGYGIGAAHNATIWAEGNIFDNVGFPFLRSRHGHARGFAVTDPGHVGYRHTGHNHFYPDGPGFLVTGDNIRMEDGSPIGAMPFPAFGDWGYRNTVRGLDTQADFDNLVAAIGNLQPNVMDAATASTFDPNEDLGITINEQAVMMVPPVNSTHHGQVGFPQLNANANANGWGFEGDFRPSTDPSDVWPTGTLAEAALLRTYIETHAGAIPRVITSQPTVAPANVNVSLNEFRFIMHAQPSPMPSLRTIDPPHTFRITWDSTDVFTEYYEFQFEDAGGWRTLDVIPAGTRANVFNTHTSNDYGYYELQSAVSFIDRGHPSTLLLVHFGGDGYTIMFPNLVQGPYGQPVFSESDIPTLDDIIFPSSWVVADLESGGTYSFRMRAVNRYGASDWTTVNHVVPVNHRRIVDIAQETPIVLATGQTEIAPMEIEYTVMTSGIPAGTYNISLSVPRSIARAELPWPSITITNPPNNPAANNLTGVVRLLGATSFPAGGQDGAGVAQIRNNGGTGTITIAPDGTGTITVETTVDIPTAFLSNGALDLVLSLQIGITDISLPFTLLAAEVFEVSILNNPVADAAIPGQTVNQFDHSVGRQVTLVAGTRPSPYSQFVNWTSTSPGVVINNPTSETNATFIMPPNDVVITANWQEPPAEPLDAPVITITGDRLDSLTWPAVANALSYTLYVDGVVAQTNITSPFDLTSLDLAVGDHDIHVRAIGDDIAWSNSALSNMETYTVFAQEAIPLAAPAIAIAGNSLTWSAVANASSYRLYVHGVVEQSNVTSPFDLTSLGLAEGTYDIQVRAIGDGTVWSNSALSNTVVYVVAGVTDPTEEPTDDSTSFPVIPLPPSTPSAPGYTPAPTIPQSTNRPSANQQNTVPANYGETMVPVRVQNNQVTLNLNTTLVNTLIAEADEAVVFDMSGIENVTTAVVPTSQWQRIADAGLDIELLLPAGTVAFDNDAAQSIADQSRGGSISTTISTVDSVDLPEAQQAGVREGDYVFRIEVMAGNQRITEIDGMLAITVDFSGNPPVAAWRLNNDGSLEQLTATFNADNATVTFLTDRLSIFTVGTYSPEDMPEAVADPGVGFVTLPATLPSATLRLTIGSQAYTHMGITMQADAAPFIDPTYNRTMIPLRLVADGMGAAVQWDDATRTVYLSHNGVQTSLIIDTPLPGDMGVPVIVNDRTFVPARYVSEILGAEVRWDEDAQAVYIYQ